MANRKLTHQEFIERLSIINPDITVISEYNGMHEKIECRCNCGHEWITSALSLANGHGCPKCGMVKNHAKRVKSHDVFVEEVHNINPNISVIGTYVNCSTKIEFKCENGHLWFATPDTIRAGHSCPICFNERRGKQQLKTHEQFIADLFDVNPDIKILGKYEKSDKKIECKNIKCGHEWLTTPSMLLSGYGCPRCCTSKGEKIIEDYLICNEIDYVFQKRFDDCRDQRTLPFDFYLPQYNLCIEYQGSQHYMPTRRFGDNEKLLYRQNHNRIKREYCRDKGINLLEIPYTNFNSISQILTDVISTGNSDLLNTKLGGVNTWQNQSA